uniref:H-2 class I histocompatibility antigen, Q10 alpha chain-like n=1 Tax=Euleptes europaea TaxID=460621 RepID=UPI002541F7B5|nr:H-2 class I histocompatibility antigen, Q10 alpha chain-like [Euleptes europaea]
MLMPMRRGRCLLLPLLLGVVAPWLEDCSASSHSLGNFYTAVSEPSPGLPQFIAVGYVDDQLITHYDSRTRRKEPIAPWMRKVEQDEPQYWAKESPIMQGNEQRFRALLASLQDQNSSTGPPGQHTLHNISLSGLHTLQQMFSCKVGPDGQPRGGSWQYGYDGENCMSLNMENVTWTALMPQAKILMQKLDDLQAAPQYHKSYLETTCIKWLRRYLDYGNETLRRTEPPRVKVARNKGNDDQETLICRVYGFYPKAIMVTWKRDEDQLNSTERVVPNSDGTYHTWLSINIDPKDRNRYQCHVEHDAFPEPVAFAWEKPASNLGLIWGIVMAVMVALVLLGAGVTFYMSDGDQGSDCSVSRNGVQRSTWFTTWNPIFAGLRHSQRSATTALLV